MPVAAASHLRQVRQEKGLTQVQLSQESGVDQGTISRIERGARPRIDVAQRLASALGSTVEALFPLPLPVEEVA